MSGTPQRADVPERGLLIGGKSVRASSGKLTEDISPWDGEIYARVAAGTTVDITRAADAAQAAFPSWSRVGAFERREIFLRAADVIARRGEEAIAALAGETGTSRVFSEFNLAFCIQVLRQAAAAITRPMGELLPTSLPGAYSVAQRIPFGVVGAISPWNAPLVRGIRSIAIPLAVGNTVVMKPSEDAPITCGLLLADALTEAGLPAGVLNVVTNDLADAGDVVAALIADPRVRMVNFTGSTRVGRIIGVQAARHLKPAVLELGGKNPLIILEDADPDLAVDAAVFGAFMNSGQICMSTDRIIIHKSLVERFIPRYVERVKAGDGEIGGPNGTLIRPAVLTDVTSGMDIFASEIFGPATVIHPVDSAEAAIDLANDTGYGLTGEVISRNLNAALDVVSRVRSGIIHITIRASAMSPWPPSAACRTLVTASSAARPASSRLPSSAGSRSSTAIARLSVLMTRSHGARRTAMASPNPGAHGGRILPDYVLVPRASLGPALNDQGYFVGRVERNLDWVTDGDYHSAFRTPPDGVVLFDAPPSIGHNLQRAVDEIAAAEDVSNTVTHLVYTHHHSDHAGGSSLFGAGVVRIGHAETRRLLLRDNDPAKPAPEETFADQRTLELGGERIELAWHGANHSPDNIYIHLPDHDTLMLVDIALPGWVPFYSINLSEDVPGYLAAPDIALSYPWQHLIAGHLGRLGTRDDLVLHQQYIADAAAAPVIEKYTGVLGAVDVFTTPTAFTILESIRLDLGYRMDVHS